MFPFYAMLWLLLLPAYIQVLRGLRMLLVPVPPEAVTRRVLNTVAVALEAGRPVAEDLELLLVHLPSVWGWRLRRGVRRLRAGTSVGIMAELHRCRLLPTILLEGAVASEQAGPNILTAWCRTAVDSPTWEVDANRLLATLGLQVMTIGIIGTFLQVVILPKFQQIGRELGMPLDPRLEVLDFVPRVNVLIPLVILVALALSLLLVHLTWRAARRLSHGQAILAGTAQGLTESNLAVLVGADLETRAAASQGDFTAIARSAGFPRATDPTALAAALDDYRTKLRRRGIIITTTLEVMIPVLMAIPVAIIAMGLIGTLVAILTQVGGASP